MGRHSGPHLLSQHSVHPGRWISTSLRLAWSAQWVLASPCFQKESIRGGEGVDIRGLHRVRSLTFPWVLGINSSHEGCMAKAFYPPCYLTSPQITRNFSFSHVHVRVIYVCAHVCTYVGVGTHAGGGSWLTPATILYCSSALLKEAGSLCQTQSSLMCLVLLAFQRWNSREAAVGTCILSPALNITYLKKITELES